ncbi:MAG TPA: hypothetical protein VN030_06760 [Cellvibrio sp.]|nr:hypothetical protein [Cellvibrio sp.]
MKIKTLKLLCAASMSLVLAACGGGNGSALEQEAAAINKNSSSAATAYSSSGVVDTTSPAQIGNGEGATFVQNVIGSNKPAGDLSAGGTVILTVNVVSVTKTLVTTPVEITFNSPCFANREAILKVGNTATNKVTAENGSASISYTANGCVGNDEITAGASINGSVVNARLTMPVASDQVQSIKFVDTAPTQISLAGSGGSETSLVRFQVLGNTGAPMKDVAVNFTLSTVVGGLKLTSSSLKTDSQGYATTTVQAGNMHTSVRVTATATLSAIFTTSSQLIVSTGIPDQDSMSISATDTHPIGWDIDGVQSTLMIRLADAFNNPPPLNTNVAFITEGGTIGDGCLTRADGSCPVTWTSGLPRPTRNAPDNFATDAQLAERKLCVDSSGFPLTPDSVYDACRLERAGRVTILATAIGNESFGDTNSNGVFDEGDIFKTAADGGDCRPNVPILTANTPVNSSEKPCDDLSEAYLDKDESKTYETNEPFIDVTSVGAESVLDSVYTAGNGKYNGVLCLTEGPKCTRSQVTIRQSMTLVMTSKNLLKRNDVLPFIATKLPDATTGYETGFWLADSNGHGAGAGTTLSVDSSNLSGASAAILTKGPLAASDDPKWVKVVVTPTTPTPSGSINVVITTKTVIGDIITTQLIDIAP